MPHKKGPRLLFASDHQTTCSIHDFGYKPKNCSIKKETRWGSNGGKQKENEIFGGHACFSLICCLFFLFVCLLSYYRDGRVCSYQVWRSEVSPLPVWVLGMELRLSGVANDVTSWAILLALRQLLKKINNLVSPAYLIGSNLQTLRFLSLSCPFLAYWHVRKWPPLPFWSIHLSTWHAHPPVKALLPSCGGSSSFPISAAWLAGDHHIPPYTHMQMSPHLHTYPSGLLTATRACATRSLMSASEKSTKICNSARCGGTLYTVF